MPHVTVVALMINTTVPPLPCLFFLPLLPFLTSHLLSFVSFHLCSFLSLCFTSPFLPSYLPLFFFFFSCSFCTDLSCLSISHPSIFPLLPYLIFPFSLPGWCWWMWPCYHFCSGLVMFRYLSLMSVLLDTNTLESRQLLDHCSVMH